MHIKIELDAFGYLLFSISCFLVLIFLCLMIWKDHKKKTKAIEEIELMGRLREVEKKILKREKKSNNSSWDKLN